MSDATASADDISDIEDEEGDASSSKMSGKKLVLFIALPVLLIVVGLGGAFMMGVFGGSEEEHVEVGEDGRKVVDPSQIVFYELPELIINLQTDDPRGSFVKFKVTLELHDAAALPKIEPLMPHPPEPQDWPGWWSLAEQFQKTANELGAVMLLPGEVPQRSDRLADDPRWQAFDYSD